MEAVKKEVNLQLLTDQELQGYILETSKNLEHLKGQFGILQTEVTRRFMSQSLQNSETIKNPDNG